MITRINLPTFYTEDEWATLPLIDRRLSELIYQEAFNLDLAEIDDILSDLCQQASGSIDYSGDVAAQLESWRALRADVVKHRDGGA